MTEKHTIVVVEDEADVSRYLVAALEDEGYAVRPAPDAVRGMERNREHPDLICLDLVMPGRTGLSLYRELCAEPDLKDIPVMVVTGVSPADAAERLGLGDRLDPPDAYIEKPVDLPLFLAEVRRLLEAAGGDS